MHLPLLCLQPARGLQLAQHCFHMLSGGGGDEPPAGGQVMEEEEEEEPDEEQVSSGKTSDLL